MRCFVKLARAAAAAALFGLLFSASAPVVVHAQDAAQVVGTCGTPNQGSLPLGQVAPMTQDTTGTLCTKGGGGGGGGFSITSANYVSSGVVNLTTASATQAIAGIASDYTYVVYWHCSNTGLYQATVAMTSGGTTLDSMVVPPGGANNDNFAPGYVGGGTTTSTNTAVSLTATVATGTPSLSCVLIGFKANS